MWSDEAGFTLFQSDGFTLFQSDGFTLFHCAY